jgi:hypothetical protein
VAKLRASRISKYHIQAYRGKRQIASNVMIDKSEWLKNSKWLISTLWKNSKSLDQGGHAQAHAYNCSSTTCAQLVDIIGSPRIIEDQLTVYLGGSSSSGLIRVYLLS